MRALRSLGNVGARAPEPDAALNAIHAEFLRNRAQQDSLIAKGTELTIGRHPIKVLFELGSGQEGSAFLVQGRDGKKYVLKSLRGSRFFNQLVIEELADLRKKGHRTIKVVDSASDSF